MTTALAAQQGTDTKTPAANPGFGPAGSNDAVESGGTTASNSTYQKDRNGNQGFDLGMDRVCSGLAGLFGLAGAAGRRMRSPRTTAIHRTSEELRSLPRFAEDALPI